MNIFCSEQRKARWIWITEWHTCQSIKTIGLFLYYLLLYIHVYYCCNWFISLVSFWLYIYCSWCLFSQLNFCGLSVPYKGNKGTQRIGAGDSTAITDHSQTANWMAARRRVPYEVYKLPFRSWGKHFILCTMISASP